MEEYFIANDMATRVKQEYIESMLSDEGKMIADDVDDVDILYKYEW